MKKTSTIHSKNNFITIYNHIIHANILKSIKTTTTHVIFFSGLGLTFITTHHNIKITYYTVIEMFTRLYIMRNAR